MKPSAHKDIAVPKSLTFGLCSLYALVGLVVLAWMSLRVQDYTQPVAVIFSPHVNAQESFRLVVNAQGRPLRYGASGNIIIAQFDQKTPQEIKHLTDALFLMDPIAVGSCFMNKREIRHVL